MLTAREYDRSRASGLRDRPFIAFNICFALSVGGWTPVATLLAVFMRDQLGAALSATVIAMVIIQLVTAGVSLYAGTFASRWGSRRAYLVGAVGMTLWTVLLSAAQEGWQVIALAPLAGLVVPFHWTGVNTYVLQAVAARRRGTATGISAFVMVLAPGLLGPILTTAGEIFGVWATILGGAGVLLLASLAGWLYLPELGVAESGIGSVRQPIFVVYRRLVRGSANRIIAGARLMAGVSFGVFGLLSALVLLDLTDQLSSVGFYLAAGSIGGGASQIAIGAASDRFGRRNLLAFAMLVGATGSFMFWGAVTLPLLLIGSMLHWFGQSAFQTLITAINGDLVATVDVPAISGLHVSYFTLGVALGSLLGGLLWQFGSGLPFLISGLCLVPVIVSVFFLPQRTMPR